MNTAIFLDLFRTALNNVEAGYYDRTQWKENAKHSSTEPDLWHEIPAKYGERAFCYELYHQVRLLMDEYKRTCPQDEPFIRFQAELKKPQIEAAIAYTKGVQALDKEYFPDFLLHAPIPLDFSHQQLVIEVKSGPCLSFSDMDSDLMKLHQFITNYGFDRGLFLAVNTPAEHIQGVLTKPEARKWILDNLPRRSQIIVMAKQKPDQPLFESDLGNIRPTNQRSVKENRYQQ